MKKTIILLGCSCLLALSGTVNADVSATITGVSDYTFNGVSQTDNNPALQVSLDYAADSGFYAGTFASTIDYGDDQPDIEWDAYLGQYWQINDSFSLDAGLAYYTYQGSSDSSDYNYPELYTLLGYSSSLGTSEFNLWYSWDYFGTDAGHYIVMLAHTFELTPGHNIKLSVDRSTSTDEVKYAWGDSDAYNHFRIEYMTSWKGFDFNLAAEDTSLDWDTADSRIVVGVSHTFNF